MRKKLLILLVFLVYFTHKSPRTIALYKAIDGLLEKMEVVSSEEEFDAISKLVKTLSNGDLIDRITWTLRGIKFRLSGAEST